MMNMKHWTWFLTLIPTMNKAEHYQKYVDYTVMVAVNSGFEWMSLLDTMAQNSKRSIPEVLLIHFQRPCAVDCRTYQEWVNAGFQVRRGAIGIAVLDSEDPKKMKYLFGRGDTAIHSGGDKRWKFYSQYEEAVVCALEKTFGTTGKINFGSLLQHAVISSLEHYWNAHDTEILDGIMDSFMGWGEYNAKLQFMDAAYISACYMILQRCDKNPRCSFYESDFFCVRDFASPKAMAVLGEAICAVGNQVLDVIGKTITEQTRDNTIVAEGEKSPSAFLKPKSIKKEMEVR